MSKTIAKDLSARDLLKKTYRALKKKYGYQCVDFQKPVYAVIESDWDPCRGTRTEGIWYKSAVIVKINDGHWVLARGEIKYCSPTEGFDSDIIAIPLKEKKHKTRISVQKVAELVGEVQHGSASQVIAFSDGDLMMDSTMHARMRINALLYVQDFRNDVKREIAQKLKIDPRLLQIKLEVKLQTTREDKTKYLRYSPEFVPVLTNFIKQMLSS